MSENQERQNSIEKNDLTQGEIVRKLIAFFLPVAAGTIFQQLYNAVDGMVVSKFVGTAALAAVGGSSANIINVLVGFFVAMTNGAAIIISHLFGAKDDEGLSRAVNASFALCGVFSVIIMAIGIPLTPAFLRWMKTPADTMAGSTTYLRIYFCGVLFSLIFNMGSGILRSVGDSKRPFYYLMACCGLNIVLDLAFVVLFKMGVAGVAIATVAAQVLSAALVMIRMCKPGNSYKVTLKKMKLDKEYVPRMLRVGVPAGLQNSMYSVSNMLLQVAVNSLGTTVVAGWFLTGKIDGFYWSTINAAGVAVMAFVGQNYGARKYDRVRETNKKGLIVFGLMSIAFSVLIMSIGRPALAIFTDDTGVLDIAVLVLRFFAPTYVIWCVNEVLTGTMRGCGDAMVPTVISGLCICLFRVLWILLVFPHMRNIMGISICYPVSWVVMMIPLIIRYKRGKWLKTE